mgnify:CR=1 FL=1
MDATQTGLHSGVDDPIWHLSRILAKKKAHEYNCLENGAIAVGTLQQQITAIEKDIQTEYNPHPRMFKELRPLIREYLKHDCKSIAHRRESIEHRKVGISIKQASERIGCSEATLYREARQGKLVGCKRVGHRFVIHWPTLEAWLQSGGEFS